MSLLTFIFVLGYLSLHRTKTKTYLIGKKVLVTGGSGDLGRALIKRLKKLGCVPILWDIVDVEKTCEELGIVGYQIDLSNMESVERCIVKTKEDNGDIDILINNAGLVLGTSVIDTENAAILKLITVNTISPLWIIKGFLPRMIENRRGHIVNIASVMGCIGSGKLVPYCTSKFGLVGMGEALRMELYGSGINVTTVCSWHINTRMFQGLNTPWFTRMVAPTLDVDYVADTIIGAIIRRKRMIIIPNIFWGIHLLRFLLPVSVFDRISWWMGGNSSMESFQGRNNVLG